VGVVGIKGLSAKKTHRRFELFELFELFRTFRTFRTFSNFSTFWTFLIFFQNPPKNKNENASNLCRSGVPGARRGVGCDASALTSALTSALENGDGAFRPAEDRRDRARGVPIGRAGNAGGRSFLAPCERVRRRARARC
jgi:hypothetical protein